MTASGARFAYLRLRIGEEDTHTLLLVSRDLDPLASFGSLVFLVS